MDKHGRIHEVHVLAGLAPGLLAGGGLRTGYSRTVPVSGLRRLDEVAVLAAETELALHIGPMAQALVSKARCRVGSVDQLRESLATIIPDEKDRKAFCTSRSGTLFGTLASGHDVWHTAPPLALRRPAALGAHWLDSPSRPVPSSALARFRLADDPGRWRDNAPVLAGAELRPAPAGRPRS